MQGKACGVGLTCITTLVSGVTPLPWLCDAVALTWGMARNVDFGHFKAARIRQLAPINVGMASKAERLFRRIPLKMDV